MLTTSTDTVVGVAGGDDVITGTTATTTTDGDIIVDGSSTDNDTLNLTLTAALANTDFAVVSGIENVNINWNAFGTATIDAEDINAATITVTSSKLGYLGNLTVNNAGDNAIVASTNVDGTIDINGGTTVALTAGEGTVTVDGSATAADNLTAVVNGGTTVSVGGAGAATSFRAVTVTAGDETTSITVVTQNDRTATVVGGDATTVSVTNAGTISATANAATTVTAQARAAATTAASIVVAAAAATSVTVDGTAATTDSATITLGDDAPSLSLGVTTEVETVSLTAAADSTVALAAGAQFEEMTVNSDGAVTITATSADLAGEAIIDSTTGGLTVSVTQTAAVDLDEVEGTINLAVSHGSAMTVASGTTVTANITLVATQSFTVAGTGTSDEVSISTDRDQAQAITTTAIETTNVDVALRAADTDGIATLASISIAGDLNVTSDADLTVATVAASTNDVVFTVTGDLIVGGTALTAGSVDATGVTGDASITQSAVAAITVLGAVGANTISLAATTQDVEVTTQNDDDAINLATTTGNATVVLANGDNSITANALTEGSLTATLGDGDNTVSATGLTIGTITVVAGEGDDSVTYGAAITTGVATLELGNGANTVTLSDAAGVSTTNITMGEGDDKIIFATSTIGADSITIDMGAGTDTLDLDGGAIDLSSAAVSISGFDIIDTAGTATVDSSLVTGKTFTVVSDGANSGGVFTRNLLVTEGSNSKIIDLSNVSFSSAIATGAGGVTVTTANGTNTVTTAAGNDTINGGSGIDTISTGLGNDTVNGSGGADVIDLGGGTDTISATMAQIAVADLSAIGGAGTDTISITDGSAVDFTGGTFSGFEVLTFAADGLADATVIDQGIFSAGAVTFTLTGAADGHDDTLTITAGTVAWDVAGPEASAAAVDAPGEYFLTISGANGVLSYYNQDVAGVTTITLTGLDAGAVALVAGNLVWTA